MTYLANFFFNAFDSRPDDSMRVEEMSQFDASNVAPCMPAITLLLGF
jgi:hypothetical protein